MDLKPLLIVTSLAVIFTLEGVFPHYPDRRNRAGHALPHAITAVLNGLLTRFVLAGITISAISGAKTYYAGLVRVPGVPGFFRTILAFVLFDVWMYYWHMANHRSSFLWRFHRAHHSDIAMDASTALRFHPGELVLSTLFRLPVVVLIGMSFSELVLFEVLLNISTLFHHSNIGLPEKWDRVLRSVLATPNMHRVHHSVRRDETNSNFTSLLSVWDRLGGTFRTRENTRAIILGLPLFREERYQRLWGFLATPFLRRGIAKRRKMWHTGFHE
jgi:sterol desaturase/sphingolipid hydroxylase (fatty acid hydroxylase superfamily)